jgi:hypothetical protein
MTQDGELLKEENGGEYEFVLENDDAVSTLHALIEEARELVGRKEDEIPSQIPPTEGGGWAGPLLNVG